MRRWLRRVRFVPQMELADCGPACLAMVAGYHGLELSLRDAREACVPGRDGVTAGGIARAARGLGLEVRGLKCDVSTLSRLRGPAILHWGFNHFVVIEGVRNGRAILVDPAVGRRIATAAELESAFTGVALELKRGGDFQARAGSQRWSLLRGLLPPWATLSVLLQLMLIAQLLSIGMPMLQQVLLDDVVLSGRHDWLWGVLVALGVGELGLLLTRTARERVLAKVLFALRLKHTTAFVERLISLPAAYLGRRSNGELAQRVEAQRSLQGVALSLTEQLLNVLLLVGGVIVLLIYSAPLGAIVLVHAALRTGLVLILQSTARHWDATSLLFEGKSRGILNETVGSLEAMWGMHGRTRQLARFERSLGARLRARFAVDVAAIRLQTVVGALDAALVTLLLVKGVADVMSAELSAGALSAVLMVSRLIVEPLDGITQASVAWLKVSTIRPHVQDVLEQEPETWGSAHPAHGGIELTEVGFRHEGADSLAVAEVSARILPGEKVVLTGDSGSGKSTLAKLVAGVLEPAHGTVKVGGQNPRSCDRRVFRSRVAWVPQETFFCDATLRFNLTLGSNCSEHELLRALEVAEATTFVAALPQGLSTMMAEDGCNFSMGERQRLALARALVSRPDILLLDETTSKLDEVTEAAVWRNLQVLDATVLLITHRPRLRRLGHRTLTMASGRLVADSGLVADSASPTLDVLEKTVHERSLH